jgi:hypothetical protein
MTLVGVVQDIVTTFGNVTTTVPSFTGNLGLLEAQEADLFYRAAGFDRIPRTTLLF